MTAKGDCFHSERGHHYCVAKCSDDASCGANGRCNTLGECAFIASSLPTPAPAPTPPGTPTPAPPTPPPAPGSVYAGAIHKTEDGGKTWKTLYSDLGRLGSTSCS